MYKEAKNVEYRQKASNLEIYGFTSFVSIIDSSKLHFTRVDQLPDPFEGSFPMGMLTTREDNAQSQYYKNMLVHRMFYILSSTNYRIYTHKFFSIQRW